MGATDILQVTTLHKRFGALAATDGVDMAVRRGEIHALIGPNGAGKSTLLAQLAGHLRPDSGRIVFDGRDVTHLPEHRRVQLGLARSHQITSIFQSEFSVLDNLCLAVQARSGSSMRFWEPADADTGILERARSVAAQAGLAGLEHRPAALLSHGQQRQLEIALAIATEARLLLLDEPMAGLNGEESRAMARLIASLRGHASVVLIEHDMEAVFSLADTVSVMVYGRLIASGTGSQIKADANVRKAYLGDEVPA